MAGQESVRRPSTVGLILLGVVLVFAAAIHVGTLDHPYLPGWDEAVHAAVAGNLAKHPLTPTLFDAPFIPIDPANWQANGVWLHMPPLSFWQAALSIDLFGRSFFALRLPNLLLFLLTLALVYALGVRWHSEGAGLIGAVVLAASPFAWLQVQGYFFGDMTDVTLAFWLTACFLALDRAVATSKLRYGILAGLFQGLALLTKSALALAPCGALLVVWLLPRLKFRLDRKTSWIIPVSFLAVAAALMFAWRLYASQRWPAEFAHEESTLWAHVTSSYEGHGQPWDALFNSLLSNLFTPVFLLPALAGTALLTAEAFKTRSAAVVLQALWILGTLLPLLAVQTKVPAVLFGAAPALALAIGFLIVRTTRAIPGALASALVFAPALWWLLAEHLPAGWWSFAGKATPDMAGAPDLPAQLAFFLAALAVLFPLGVVARKSLRSNDRLSARLGRVWTIAVALVSLAPFAVELQHADRTRDGFEILATYNPIAPTAQALRDKLPERAALIVEGVTDGRRRPDLTLSFLTGHPCHLVSAPGLLNAFAGASSLGEVFLITPIRREGEELLGPLPGSGYHVYPLHGALPAPVLRPVEATVPWSEAPELLSLVPEKTVMKPGEALHLLTRFRIRGAAVPFGTRTVLAPEAGGEPDPTFPHPEDFPIGLEADTLHKLAPPGMLWGDRPLCTGMLEPGTLRPAEELADGFQIWVPAHLAPGRYRVELLLYENGRALPPEHPDLFPIVEVSP